MCVSSHNLDDTSMLNKTTRVVKSLEKEEIGAVRSFSIDWIPCIIVMVHILSFENLTSPPIENPV